MKKVYQTVFESGKGNALQAGVASIFDKELDEVPNFLEFPSYADAIADYVQKQFDLTFVKFKLPNGILDFSVKHSPLVLAAGKSPRGNFKHVIVGKIVDNEIELAHDPYPDGNGLDGKPSWIGLFVKIR